MVEYVMFDTCIWERFALSQEKQNKKSPFEPKDLTTCRAILDTIKAKKMPFKIFTSDFNILEFRDQLWKLICDKQLYEWGYLPSEFYEGRKQIIRGYDKKMIDTIKEKLEGLFVLGDEHFTHDIKFEFVTKHCEQGMMFFDAILVDQAEQHSCKYFVTTDGLLAYHFRKKASCEIITAKNFLSKIEKAI